MKNSLKYDLKILEIRTFDIFKLKNPPMTENGTNE